MMTTTPSFLLRTLFTKNSTRISTRIASFSSKDDTHSDFMPQSKVSVGAEDEDGTLAFIGDAVKNHKLLLFMKVWWV